MATEVMERESDDETTPVLTGIGGTAAATRRRLARFASAGASLFWPAHERMR
jgi:hypothetical protein